jgi:diguanylate cyclase (GGDEF)-like protein
MTISIGVASTSTHGGDRDSLIRSADAALYQAKQAGRNRVQMAEA